MNLRTVLLACLAGCAAGASAAPPGSVVIDSPVGDVRFSHDRHAGIECVTCHHTSPGIRIKRACRSCHLKNVRMPRNSPDAFHEHCLGCHLDLKKAHRPGGPAKRCGRCHQRDSDVRRPAAP